LVYNWKLQITDYSNLIIKNQLIRIAATIVVTTASHFFLSRIIPRTPSTKAAGGENIMAQPARMAIGLPQPGLKSIKNRMTARRMASNAADILPKRIVLSSKSITSLSA
jgi:hypothetical protein